jgi:hypothetical protein
MPIAIAVEPCTEAINAILSIFYFLSRTYFVVNKSKKSNQKSNCNQ